MRYIDSRSVNYSCLSVNMIAKGIAADTAKKGNVRQNDVDLEDVCPIRLVKRVGLVQPCLDHRIPKSLGRYVPRVGGPIHPTVSPEVVPAEFESR